MYTLRTFENGLESNRSLGTSYDVVNRETNYEKFSEAYELFWGKAHTADLDTESDEYTKKTFSFLVIRDGAEMIPLYKGGLYYVMTESGKTFDNLTFK